MKNYFLNAVQSRAENEPEILEQIEIKFATGSIFM